MPVSARRRSSRLVFSAFCRFRSFLTPRRRSTTLGLKTSPAAASSRVRSSTESPCRTLRSRTIDSSVSMASRSACAVSGCSSIVTAMRVAWHSHAPPAAH